MGYNTMSKDHANADNPKALPTGAIAQATSEIAPQGVQKAEKVIRVTLFAQE